MYLLSIVTTLLFAGNVLASPCLDVNVDEVIRICSGDTVYPEGFSAEGARVLGVNPVDKTVRAQSNQNGGRVISFSLSEISLVGCMWGICSGDTVYPEGFSAKGATVLGVNPVREKIRVRSNQNGMVRSFSRSEISLPGCWGICPD